MAEEPVETSICYSPCAPYVPPVGRLAVLGKARAEIDKLRMSTADDLSQINSRLAATADNTRKADAEIGLLEQKTVTELAQTCNTLDNSIGYNNTPTVEGVIDKQKNLFQKQTDGFDRDAEQKIAKIMIDTWSVRQTTDGADAGQAGLGETDIKTVLNYARAGLGSGAGQA